MASLRRAIDEGVPITTPQFWRDPSCSDTVIEHVFRSATNEVMPLLSDRIEVLREAGEILEEVGSPCHLGRDERSTDGADFR